MDGAAALRSHFTEPRTRGKRAHFFVGVVHNRDRQAFEVFGTGVLQGVENRDDARLAVAAARTVDAVAFDLERTTLGFAFGEDRVEVGVEHDVVGRRFRLVGRENPLTRLRTEIDEFGVPTDRIEVSLHDVRDLRDAFDVGTAAIDVDDFGQILQISFEHGPLQEKKCDDRGRFFSPLRPSSVIGRRKLSLSGGKETMYLGSRGEPYSASGRSSPI